MPSIYIIAGEASGDVLGGRLMTALKGYGDYDISGIGGDKMTQAGLRSLFPMQDLSLMGLFEIVPKLQRLMKRIKQTQRDIINRQPDIVLTVDSPDFCKRVVKGVRTQCPETKFIHYVAPTVWAWREGRAKTMAQLFDGLICLFPFEPQYFKAHGLSAAFCGHPAIETISTETTERTNDHVLIFPGSRKGEVKRMAPVFRETYQKMKGMNPDLQARIVAFPHFKDMLAEEFYGLDVSFVGPADRYKAMKSAPFALAKSGTTGLELAVAECPHIIAYTMNPLTWYIVKRLVKTRFAHLVNIMEDREVIPECIQHNCNAEDIMQAVIGYNNPDLSSIREKLAGQDTGLSPSQQAARYVLSFIKT